MNFKKVMQLTVLGFASAGLVVSCGPSEQVENGELADEPDAQQQEPDQQIQPEQQPQDIDVDVSSEELEKFVSIIDELEVMQAGMEGEFEEILEEEGMARERYDEISRQEEQAMMGEAADDVEVSDEEQAKLDKINERIMAMQEGMEEEMIQVIEDEGMSFDRYREINMAIQQDPELQQEFMQHMQQRQPEGDQGGY